LDYDGTFVMTGGFLVAVGTSGMTQATGTASAQRAVQITYKSAKAKNTLATIKNAGGAEILAFSPTKQYSSVVFCSPSIAAGGTCSVYSGGTYAGGTETDGLYSGGTFSGGTLSGSFTSSSVVTSVSFN
jgi:hypothetical protein